jgi:methylenetetrahydrofolate--tRNA-(uracil-5-)-methyltransferase
VEGYTESIAMGMLVARIIDRKFNGTIGDECSTLPDTTVLGQFWRRLITPGEKRFQPVNANFGLMPALPQENKKQKPPKQDYAVRSLKDLAEWLQSNHHINIHE